MFTGENNMNKEQLKARREAKREAIRKAEEARIASFYRPLTAEEKAERARRHEINVLKRKLRETDYCVIKIAEGEATSEEYASVLAERKTWRSRINELEEK